MLNFINNTLLLMLLIITLCLSCNNNCDNMCDELWEECQRYQGDDGVSIGYRYRCSNKLIKYSNIYTGITISNIDGNLIEKLR